MGYRRRRTASFEERNRKGYAADSAAVHQEDENHLRKHAHCPGDACRKADGSDGGKSLEKHIGQRKIRLHAADQKHTGQRKRQIDKKYRGPFLQPMKSSCQ